MPRHLCRLNNRILAVYLTTRLKIGQTCPGDDTRLIVSATPLFAICRIMATI